MSRIEIQPRGLLSRSVHFSHFDLIICVGPIDEESCEELRATEVTGAEPELGLLDGMAVDAACDDEGVVS